MHGRIAETALWVRTVIVGHCTYYAIPGNMKAVKEFYTQVIRAWLRIIRKQSQKGRNFTWERFRRKIEGVIPRPRLKQTYPNVRFDAALKVRAR